MKPDWQHFGRWVSAIIGSSFLGALVLGGGTWALLSSIDYVYPAMQIDSGETYRPFLDGSWLKIPGDIVRTRNCLAQSTVTIHRQHDYGGTLGLREDIVVLGLYNTTLTPIGEYPVMLWFKLPDLPSGTWGTAIKVQDDCGGLFDFSARKPRQRESGAIFIPPSGDMP